MQLVEAYAQGAGPVPHRRRARTPIYSETIELDLVDHRAEPRRPEAAAGSRALKKAKSAFQTALPTMQVPSKPLKGASAAEGGARQGVAAGTGTMAQSGVAVADPALDELDHGAVVIAAITSCTNTSNPSVMIGAGLRGQEGGGEGAHAQAVGEEQPRARLEGRHRVPRRRRPDAVPRSARVQSRRLRLHDLHRQQRPAARRSVAPSIREKNLVVCSVLSGNRNFEGRIQQDVRANYLASPPLVVAYALAGWITKDLTTEPLGNDQAGNPVYLKDIWPTEQELQETMLRAVTSEMFRRSYADVFDGDERWQELQVPEGSRFAWDDGLDLHPQADVPRRHDDDAAGAGRHHRRARAGAARRQRDHRPHLAGRIDQGGQPGGQVPDREGRASRPTSTRTARAAATTR